MRSVALRCTQSGNDWTPWQVGLEEGNGYWWEIEMPITTRGNWMGSQVLMGECWLNGCRNME